MYHTTLSGVFTLLGLCMLSICLTNCDNNTNTNNSKTKLEGDPRKMSIYTVEVKRTDIDTELPEIDCAAIPTDPCYCIVETRGDTSYVTAHIKNCGDDGTAEHISIVATVYPQGASPISFNSSSSNPESLAQGAAATISFSTESQFSNQIDSAVFVVNWEWDGGSTTITDTISSIVECSTCP